MRIPLLIKAIFAFALLLSQNLFAISLSKDTLSANENVATAQSYYEKKIKTNTSTSASAFEKLEHKVNAKQAFDSKEWYGARNGFMNVLADNPDDFQAWILFCKTLLEMQREYTYENYDEAIHASFVKAWQTAKTDLDRAVVLWLIFRNLNQDKALHDEALKLAKQEEIENRWQLLTSTYPNEFAPYHLDIPARTDIGTACTSWTFPLLKSRHFHYDDYVSLTPNLKDISVIARGNQLCIEGLTFGSNFQVTFKAGMPGEQNVKLAQNQTVNIFVPHRKSAIRFRERGFILASHNPQIVPFVAVNVDKVYVKIIHVPERNIQTVQSSWFANQFWRWETDKLKEENGEVIWQGIYHCKGEMDKTGVTGLPIDKMIGKKLEPGVYVIEASLSDDGYDSQEYATQALIISDIGLSTYQGPDGLHVLARSLRTAKPLSGVEVTLIARNNRELAKLKTQADGFVHFSDKIQNGEGGNKPAYISALLKGKEFTVLNLRDDSFDLTDRGASGRAKQPIEGYIFTERGIYRPGESVHLLSLVRDSKGNALKQLPLTLRLYRPDGVLAQEILLEDKGAGSYPYTFAINNSAQTGHWTASIYADTKGDEIGQTTFEVNDFVPPRIEVKTTSSMKSVMPHQVESIGVQVYYYFGPPGANLKVEAESSLVLAQNPFKEWKGYTFGLEEEPWSAQKFKSTSTTTDTNGKATVTAVVDRVPQTTRMLQLETNVSVFEAGGRARITKQVTPFWHQPFVIGISSNLDENASAENTKAQFSLIALNQKGQLQASSNLRYTLFAEQHDYVWYKQNTQWQYEVVTRDKIVSSGSVSLNAERPTSLNVPVQYGSYRLEVLDEKTGVASSRRFNVGWYQAADAPDRPDLLEIKLSDVNAKQAKVFVKSPFAGELMLAFAGETFIPVHQGKISTEGVTLTIPLKKALTEKSGAYLLATVYRPSDEKKSQMPARAIGITWVENAKNKEMHQAEVQIEAPEKVNSGKTFEVKVNAPNQKEMHLVLALVDEGTLSLIDYKTPDPFAFFFGQSMLDYALRDSYGHLINPFGARVGSFEVGGDGVAGRILTQLATKSVKVISLYSGIVEMKGKEGITLPFNVPDYSGKLRVMAVAWNDTKVGHAQKEIIVRDEIDLYLAMPRFLAPNDDALIPVIVKNIEGKPGNYQLNVTSSAGTLNQQVVLNKEAELRIPFKQKFTTTGVKPIEATLKGPDGNHYKRQYKVAVRQGLQSVSLKQYGTLAPMQTLNIDKDLLKDFQANNAQVVLSVGSLPNLGSKQLIEELKAYPYFCLEQTTSRLLAQDLACQNKDLCAKELEKGFNQLSSLQKIDGSFSLWSQEGATQGWLTIYATDILNTLKQDEHQVPQALWANAIRWVQDASNRSINKKGDISLIAYSHYVLAKEKQGSLSALRFFADNAQSSIVLKSDKAFVAGAFAYYGDAQSAATWFDKAMSTDDVKEQNDDMLFGSGLRDSAILLTVMAQTTQNHPKLLSLLDDLVNKAKGARYLSTQEKAWLIRAASAVKSLQKEYAFTLNQSLHEGKEPFFQTFTVDQLKNTVQLMNKGSSPLYYSLSLVGEPLDTKSLTQEGFEINREIYTTKGDLVEPLQFKSGELYLVVIKAKRLKDNLHHVILVDMLPAGFEIEDPKLSEETLVNNFSWLGSLTRASRIEGRDDRFVAAFELGQQSQINAAYLVRAVTSGTFRYPPVYIESMYQPQYFKYGVDQAIQVDQN